MNTFNNEDDVKNFLESFCDTCVELTEVPDTDGGEEQLIEMKIQTRNGPPIPSMLLKEENGNFKVVEKK